MNKFLQTILDFIFIMVILWLFLSVIYLTGSFFILEWITVPSIVIRGLIIITVIIASFSAIKETQEEQYQNDNNETRN